MKIRLLCVGKPRDRGLAALHDRYAKRISRFGVGYESNWVPEVRSSGRFSEDHCREREARALLEAVDPKGEVVALDHAGDLLTSSRLGGNLESWATPVACFVVGGALGLHSRILDEADRVWSLSPLTFPHELVRLLVAEQLYRALTIARRMPYHK